MLTRCPPTTILREVAYRKRIQRSKLFKRIIGFRERPVPGRCREARELRARQFVEEQAAEPYIITAVAWWWWFRLFFLD